MSTPATKPEFLGFRDEEISAWHRSLGFDLPATDIDFLLIEYDKALPKALIEYKHQNSKKIPVHGANIRATSALATRAKIPFFVVRYSQDFTSFGVIPLNSYARLFVPGRELMGKESFIKLLERLRK